MATLQSTGQSNKVNVSTQLSLNAGTNDDVVGKVSVWLDSGYYLQ